jgi:hypothetical protein
MPAVTVRPGATGPLAGHQWHAASDHHDPRARGRAPPSLTALELDPNWRAAGCRLQELLSAGAVRAGPGHGLQPKMRIVLPREHVDHPLLQRVSAQLVPQLLMIHDSLWLLLI